MEPDAVIGPPETLTPVPAVKLTEVTVPVFDVKPDGLLAGYAPRFVRAVAALVAPVPPLAMASAPDVICDAAIAIADDDADVSCPCALIAMTGTDDALPYVDALTPVFVMLKTVPASVRPVPAEYRTGAANCVKTNAVVPTVIGSGVCCTHDVLACVDPAVTRKKSPWLI